MRDKDQRLLGFHSQWSDARRFVPESVDDWLLLDLTDNSLETTDEFVDSATRAEKEQ